MTVLETPYADVNTLLKRLLSHTRRIFRENLIGVYLYGSLTTGDFDLQSSDIDLLAAIASDVSAAEFEALRAMHRDIAREYPVWEDRIEVAYLSVAALRTFRSQKSPIAVISPGEPFHMKDAGADWLMNWYIVREKGLVLFGPQAQAIIAPISQDEFVQAVREHAAGWDTWVHQMRDRKRQAYAILTMCRALHVHKTGQQASKRQAALWAQKEWPEWAELIQSALAWREAWREERVDHAATDPETIHFVSFARDQILTPGG